MMPVIATATILNNLKKQTISTNKRCFSENKNITVKKQAKLQTLKSSTNMKAPAFYENDPHDGSGIVMLVIAAFIVFAVLMMLYGGGMPEDFKLENTPFAKKETATTILETIKMFLKKWF